MALKCNDFLDNGNSIRTIQGGNGDFYVEIIHKDENGVNSTQAVRIAMSGGRIKDKTRLKHAFAELHFAMEEAELNEFPD